MNNNQNFRFYIQVRVKLGIKSNDIFDELKTVFAGTKIEPVLYRISTYIWNIKKDGGVVQSVKDKRKLIGYQLLNHDEFNDQGYWVGKTDVKVAA
jgi:hypothetical protein